MFFLKFKEFLRIIKQGGENMKKKNNMWDSGMPDLSESMRMPNLFESMQPRPRPPVRPYPSPYPRRTVVVRPRIVYARHPPRGTSQKPLLTRQQIQTGQRYASTGAKYARKGISQGISFIKQKMAERQHKRPERIYNQKKEKWSFEKKEE